MIASLAPRLSAPTSHTLSPALATSSLSLPSTPLCSPNRNFRPLLAFAASIALSFPPNSALSATIKMGADEGTLVFVPATTSVIAGEKITFFNNRGFPHNVIFEKDGVPVGVEVEKISHEDYMNDRGEQFVVTLNEKGTYKFYCEPHRAAGMFGEVVVT